MSADGNVVAFTTTRHEPVERRHRRQHPHRRVRARRQREHDRARVPHVHRTPASPARRAPASTRRSPPTGATSRSTPKRRTSPPRTRTPSVTWSCATASPARRRSSAARRAPPARRATITPSLPQISADGTQVAFASLADNLGSISNPDPETPLHRLNVYVRDLAAGTTMLASRANGAAGRPATPTPAASRGSRSPTTAPRSCSTRRPRTSPPPRAGRSAIQSFLRNLSTNTTQAVAGGAASSQWPVISGDGTHVAFFTASGLVSGDTDGQLDIYLHRYVPGARRRRRRRRRPTPTATPAGAGPPLRRSRRRRRSRCAATPRSRAARPTTSTSPARRSTSTSSTCCPRAGAWR